MHAKFYMKIWVIDPLSKFIKLVAYSEILAVCSYNLWKQILLPNYMNSTCPEIFECLSRIRKNIFLNFQVKIPSFALLTEFSILALSSGNPSYRLLPKKTHLEHYVNEFQISWNFIYTNLALGWFWLKCSMEKFLLYGYQKILLILEKI